MEKHETRSPGNQRRDSVIFLLLLLFFGLGFFVRNAHLQLAADDVGWLRGETPTVFDQYRIVPRLFFVSFYALFGASPVAALVMIFVFHFANSLLVGRLGQKLLGSQSCTCRTVPWSFPTRTGYDQDTTRPGQAPKGQGRQAVSWSGTTRVQGPETKGTGQVVVARVAAVVFLINPITLSTLTWISCFSYVLGTSLALGSLFAAWRGSAKDAGRPLFWWLIAVACYGAGLFCSHEVFFLPVLFLLFDWLRGDTTPKWGTVFFGLAMVFAVLVSFFVYDFGRYGVETSRLFTPGFISAFASSVLSFALGLGLAYPLSFFVKTLDFLRLCFTEPLRWGMTLVLLAAGVLFYKPNKMWRLWLTLTLSFAALIAPYIIRLYLTPDKVGYHISYVLSGRVFYLPFTIIALMWGGMVAQLYRERVKEQKLAWLLFFLPVVAYFHAFLVLYDRTDFMGLQVLHESSQSFPPSWSPYTHHRPVWSVGSVLVLIIVVAIRLVAEKRARMRRAKHETPSS